MSFMNAIYERVSDNDDTQSTAPIPTFAAPEPAAAYAAATEADCFEVCLVASRGGFRTSPRIRLAQSVMSVAKQSPSPSAN